MMDRLIVENQIEIMRMLVKLGGGFNPADFLAERTVLTHRITESERHLKALAVIGADDRKAS